MYDIVLDRRVGKEIDGLPLRQAGNVIAALKLLANWPQHGCDVKPLKGPYHGKWRLRVGEYRVIFSVDDARRMIIVARIASRGQVY